ncbi:hypothetical protein M5W68_00025 [Paenibacillus larvae]|uniref:hypothetical protein n=1 Tax=Paenibacillus larvae TaxID=1464 RepID=UPI0022831B92|nr:hypothetical protein [Paenibacillus larvae]MCY9511977.1 hypothetical protein [Paenibacillus larvae]MCY9523594.1 hypothetical protein [Paenibacillus larvae]
MKTVLKIIKFLLTTAIIPICLILLWIYNMRPFTYFSQKMNLDYQITDNASATIDQAVLVFVLTVFIKLIETINRPKISVSINDPKDPNKDAIVKYSLNQGLKKLIIQVHCDYKYLFCKKLGSQLMVEIHWGDWLSIEIDEPKTKQLNGELSKNKWCVLTSEQMGVYDIKIQFEVPLYFSVNGDSIKNGFITPKLRFKRFKLTNFLFFLFISREEESIEIKLMKE